MSIRVTVWNENLHEKTMPALLDMYPEGIHGAISGILSEREDITVTCVTMDMPHQGLPDSLLDNTDVLIWWGHMGHHLVEDSLVLRVKNRVLSGMGFIPLHSAHASKPFVSLMGTTGALNWGEDQQQLMWCAMPGHPIAAGIPDCFELETEEMYGEPFDIPQPDELVFLGWFKHGNLFRAGCCFFRGQGRIFYFQPGHESCPSYNNPHVRRIITNAVYWASPSIKIGTPRASASPLK